MNRVHYDVDGLQNTQTKTQIKNALDKIDGIQMINVDVDRSTVEVGYNDRTNEECIKQCIEHVGCNIK